MSTMEQYLKGMKVGNYVMDKRTLAAMKKSGFIGCYNKWGEILPFSVYRKNKLGIVSQWFEYLGSEPKEGEKGSKSNPLLEGEKRGLNVVFKGYKFGIEYGFNSDKAHLQFLGEYKEKKINVGICVGKTC